MRVGFQEHYACRMEAKVMSECHRLTREWTSFSNIVEGFSRRKLVGKLFSAGERSLVGPDTPYLMATGGAGSAARSTTGGW